MIDLYQWFTSRAHVGYRLNMTGRSADGDVPYVRSSHETPSFNRDACWVPVTDDTITRTGGIVPGNERGRGDRIHQVAMNKDNTIRSELVEIGERIQKTERRHRLAWVGSHIFHRILAEKHRRKVFGVA